MSPPFKSAVRVRRVLPTRLITRTFLVFLSVYACLAYCGGAHGATAVVVIHGGGWWTGSAADVQPVCDALPEFDCYRPSYTLSMTAPFPAANVDLRAYVAELRLRGYDRVLAVGLSAGGNLSAWLAARGYVDGAVTWSAPSDLRVFDWWRRTPGWVVHRFAPYRSDRRRASPAWHGVDVPILIIHSRRERMPLDQARRLRAASPLGRLVVLDGRDHAMGYFDRAMPLTRGWLVAYA